MTYFENVKSSLFNIIHDMSLNPDTFSLHPGRDFSRRRKADFEKTISFSLSMESGCMNHEILKFFKYDDDAPSAFAFFQQRAKLNTNLFRHLIKEFDSCFPLSRYGDKYFLIACDGSEFNIPRNPDDAPSYNPPNKTALNGFNMIHTVFLYDVLNKRYLDLEVQPSREKNEYRALCSLMDRYSYGGCPIIISDRGFASYNVFAHAFENNIDFVIRAKDVNIQRIVNG